MATMIEQKCWCGTVFLAREADVKRGWGKACNKQHAAHAREKALDRNNYSGHSKYKPKQTIGRRYESGDEICDEAMDDMELGWDGHKNSW